MSDSANPETGGRGSTVEAQDSAPTLNVSDVHRMNEGALAKPVTQGEEGEPIPMVLFCPKCSVQHVDEADVYASTDLADGEPEGWTNPPHRSHLCCACGCIWRPADVATTGVQSITTKGKADNWSHHQHAAPAPAVLPEGVREAVARIVRILVLDHTTGVSPDAVSSANLEAKAIREIRALLAAPSVEGGGWRPIESAPRDEVQKLGWNSGSFYILQWPMVMQPGNDEEANKQWFDGDVYIEPTHWRPLPPAPDAQAEGGRS